MNVNPIFDSQEEYDTICHLHDVNMAVEVLSVDIPELVDVVTYRGDCDKHLQLCARQMNTFMRENYKGFIHNVGKNIYPLIIASDYEADYQGVGSTFTLYLRDGSQHKIAPTVDTNYEIYKAISHMALATFVILSPHFKNPSNLQWHDQILKLKKDVEIFEDAVIHSNKDEVLKKKLLSLVLTYLSFYKQIIGDGKFSLEHFLVFTKDAFKQIKTFMDAATLEQAKAILPAMIKWKKMLGPTEWSKVYIMIPTVWPVALNSPRLQLFERLVDPDKIKTHIITSEFPRNLDEAKDTVGRVVGDRAVGRIVFGNQDTKAKMKVLALSSRTDVVADDFEINLQKVFLELNAEDAKYVNPPSNLSAAECSYSFKVDDNGIPPGCPMHQPKSKTIAASAATPRNQQSIAICNVHMLNSGDTFDIITNNKTGLIESIYENTTGKADLISDCTIIDGTGKTILPGFVDAHIHLDKCYLLDRCCALHGDFPEAMTETTNAKKNFTIDDIRSRARKLIEDQISFGTSLIRAHIEVDPIIGMKAVDAILPLKAEYSNAITIQLCVFAQEGITNQPNQIELLREALSRGCDVIASAVYCDPLPTKNIDIIFELAKEFNVPVDFHMDYHLEGKPSFLDYTIEKTIFHGWQGRVCLGHMTYLSTFSKADIAALAVKLIAADISILALPASDICMMGRNDDGNKRRGVCPVDQLYKAGVTASFATNNVQNLFTFTGDGDVLKVGTLLCQLLHLTSISGTTIAASMATTIAAKAIGVLNHKVEVDCPADLVILPGVSSMHLLAAPPVERIVIKQGRLVSKTEVQKSAYY